MECFWGALTYQIILCIPIKCYKISFEGQIAQPIWYWTHSVELIWHARWWMNLEYGIYMWKKLVLIIPVYILCVSYSLLMVCTILYRACFKFKKRFKKKRKKNQYNCFAEERKRPNWYRFSDFISLGDIGSDLKGKATQWDIYRCKLCEGERETADAACRFWASHKPAHGEGEIFWDAEGDETVVRVMFPIRTWTNLKFRAVEKVSLERSVWHLGLSHLLLISDYFFFFFFLHNFFCQNCCADGWQSGK